MTASNPYELCQQYAAGQLTQDETVRQLSAWPYVRMAPDDMRTSPGDDLMIWPQGTTQELIDAEYAGLIDSDMVEQILDGVYGLA